MVVSAHMVPIGHRSTPDSTNGVEVCLLYLQPQPAHGEIPIKVAGDSGIQHSILEQNGNLL